MLEVAPPVEGRHPYVLADVFAARRFAGNPLAVFPFGGAVPPEAMPLIARELNLSEIVFVLPPDGPGHAARLRILTPQMELPFAGHPTVGAACVLLATGAVRLEGGEGALVLEEGVGPVPVRVGASDGRMWARLTVPGVPESGPEPPDRATLAQLLSIAADEIGDGDLAPVTASCGVPFLYVPVRDRAVLGRVRLDPGVWAARIAGSWAPHVYVITRDVELAGSAVRARMFAPAMGIAEDPATGAAASALAGVLWWQSPPADGVAFRIEQGFEMGRPSLIDVEGDVEEGELVRVRVGGEAVLVGRGEIHLDD